MERVFVGKLKIFLDAVANKMELYVPKMTEGHYVFRRYQIDGKDEPELNSIRTCTPVKEFLFPVRELAATFPEPLESEEIKPFAVFGLKECDLMSIAILDEVFLEQDYEDTLYKKRREKMFIISSDCIEPGESCFCNLFEGKGYPEKGFDLNVSRIRDGFIIEVGSRKGHSFIEANNEIFAEAPEVLVEERDDNRQVLRTKLEQQNRDLKFEMPIRDIVEGSEGSAVYDTEAGGCIECQACTRVCPTCHCFYLYDDKQKDYFTKMKIWDSCMRFGYSAVAGGANPNKVLGDRMKHRLMHKFVHFLDRYGVNMCVGCGRCVDSDAGGMDLRRILKKLSEETKDKDKEQTKVVK